jgi:GcrA cell cycle regulator
MSWTEQQIQALKKMWGNGYSASDIAKALGGGLTRNAVIGKAHRLKLSAGQNLARQPVRISSEAGGSVLPSMVKAGKKRAMLRPLPPVQAPGGNTAARPTVREVLKNLENIKRTEGIAVTKAGERHCRWPIGDPRSPDFRFCGAPCYEGLPYCVDHARVAYQTVSRRSRANSNDGIMPEFKLPNVHKY